MKRRDPPSELGGLRPARATAASAKARAGRSGDRQSPMASGRLYDAEESEFLKAVNTYQQAYGLRFLAATDFLRVLKGLGYRKVPGVAQPYLPSA